jgi:outer membrane protein assembly factor BamB
MRNFDPVFYVTAVGNSVYFGSSVDDSAHCLNAETGVEKWTFFTDAPIRLPPSWYKGKVYFGSDDGYAYCLDAEKGTLLWKHKPAVDDRFIPSNGKLISLWPCRTGVLVQNGKAYFAASLLPWKPSYLCAIDADTGSDTGAGLYKSLYNEMTIQGAMLASSTKLYLSQGRQRPIVCNLATGKILGSIGNSGDGGVYALLTEDSTFVHGHGQNHRAHGELRGFNAQTTDSLATFSGATCMVATNNMAYLHANGELSAFDRIRYLDLKRHINTLSRQSKDINARIKKLGEKSNNEEGKRLKERLQNIRASINGLNGKLPECFRWKVDCPYPHALILAGDVLFAGGDNSVAAFSIKDGRELWNTSVKGTTHGLTAANGHLFVSTDRGKIYCFTGGQHKN